MAALEHVMGGDGKSNQSVEIKKLLTSTVQTPKRSAMALQERKPTKLIRPQAKLLLLERQIQELCTSESD